MRKIKVLLGAVLVLSFLTAGTAQASFSPTPIQQQTLTAPDPVTCEGYPQPRVGVEIQSWWRDRTGEAFPGRHIHVYTCWPTSVVSGTVTFDMRVLAHAQPTVNFVKRLRMTNGSSGDLFAISDSYSTRNDFLPLDSSGNMTQWFTRSINTNSLSAGLHEMRLAAYVSNTKGTATTSDDFDQLVSSGLPLFVRTMSGGSTSRDYVEARGWYPNFLYTNVRYRNRLSDFLTTKSGIWQPKFQCSSPSGENADLGFGSIDPNWHEIFAGYQQFSRVGEGYMTPSIDTRLLSNGTHKIVVRCEADANLSPHNGFSAGVLAINFNVQN